MTISRFLGLAAASLMIVTPVVANAQAAQSSASRLSLAQSTPARAGAPMGTQSKLGGNSLWIIGAVALLGGVIWAVADDSDNDNPASN